MEFSEFFLKFNDKTERLKDIAHGVRKDQITQKFQALFDFYDTNKDGTLEEDELSGIFTCLEIFADSVTKGDKTLDTSENRNAASIFSSEYIHIEDADFMGFVKSISDAGENIISSETKTASDGGKEIITKYKDGTVETISYYSDGDFKWKKTEKKLLNTTYEVQIDGQTKKLTEDEYNKALEKLNNYEQQEPQNPQLTDGSYYNIINVPSTIPNIEVSSRTDESKEVKQKFSPRFIAESIGVNTETEDGKKIIQRLALLPEEIFEQIDIKELKDLLISNNLNSDFDNLSNILEIVYGYTLRNDEELEESKPQREKIITQIKAAQLMINIFDMLADWNDEFTDSLGVYGIASEGLGYILNKLGLDRENNYQWADSCREFAQRAAELKVFNTEEFNEGFKNIYGNDVKAGIEFNEEAFKKLFEIVDSGNAVDEKGKPAKEYKEAVLNAMNLVIDNPNDSTFLQVMNGLGEALVMIMTLGLASEAEAGEMFLTSTMSTFSRAGVSVASKQVSSKLLQGALRLSGNTIKLIGPAISEGTKMYLYTAAEGTTSNIFNRVIKNGSEDNSFAKFVDTEISTLDNASGSFAFGAFAGVYGSTITSKVMQYASKVSTKVEKALAEKFTAGSVSANDVFAEFIKTQTPTKIAEVAAFASDVLGFTAFESALTLAKNMDGFPDKITIDDITNLIWNEFKGQGYNLGQIKGISYLIMWMSGSRSARANAANALKNNFPQLDRISIQKKGKGYTITMSDGKTVDCKNTNELITATNLIVRNETALSKLFNSNNDTVSKYILSSKEKDLLPAGEDKQAVTSNEPKVEAAAAETDKINSGWRVDKKYTDKYTDEQNQKIKKNCDTFYERVVENEGAIHENYNEIFGLTDSETEIKTGGKTVAVIQQRIKDRQSLNEKIYREIERVDKEIRELEDIETYNATKLKLGDESLTREKADENIERYKIQIENLINNFETDMSTIMDAYGARIVMDDTSPETINKVFQNLLDTIDSGKIKIKEIDNYWGNGVEPYFSEEQVEEINKHCMQKGYLPKRTNGVKASGYTTFQINIEHENGIISELQIRGSKINDMAESEHIYYDIREGKDPAKGNPEAQKLLEPYIEAAKLINEKGNEYLKEAYSKYLTEYYKFSRLQEQGKPCEKPVMPDGLDEVLDMDNLIKLHEQMPK